MELFRREVLQARRARLEGDVLLLPRWPHVLLAAGLSLWVVAAAVFLTQGQYARKETVRGWLEPAAGLVQVYPQAAGRVARLLVQPGDPVHVGMPLAIVNGDHQLKNGSSLETLLVEALSSKQHTLQQELERQASLTALRTDALATQLADVARTHAALLRQRTALSERLDIAESRLQRHSALIDQGHIPRVERDRLRDELLHLQSTIDAMDAALAEKAAERTALTAERDQLPEQLESRRNQLLLSLSDLAQDMARLQGERAHVLVAPIHGSVDRISLKTGQQAHPSSPLLTLLPADSPLVARLMVPVRAAGFLSHQQPLAIRYDAFPFQKFGIQAGELTSIPRSALIPAEQHQLPVRLDEPVYRVSGRPAAPTIRAYGQDFSLKTGMTLSADIELEQRSLLEWLLEPLIGLRGKLR
ncbi:MAG: HlyD family efflux transporter periplasmic adaptor subunit [Pseudomonadota bacterium]